MKSNFLSALLFAFAVLSAEAEPWLEKQDLFIVGEDPAYQLYHIPDIVVTASTSAELLGTMLSIRPRVRVR